MSKKKQYILGLTGFSNTGKTTASKYFAKQGFEIIELDRLGHEALEEQKEIITQQFGKNFLRGGQIDRKALAELVFSEPKKLHTLEKILHPQITKKLIHKLQNTPSTEILIIGAILHKMKLARLCTHVLLITSSHKTLIKRAQQRDNLSIATIKKRLKSQSTIKKRHTDVDFIIQNESSLTDLEKSCEAILKQLTQRI